LSSSLPINGSSPDAWPVLASATEPNL